MFVSLEQAFQPVLTKSTASSYFYYMAPIECKALTAEPRFIKDMGDTLKL